MDFVDYRTSKLEKESQRRREEILRKKKIEEQKMEEYAKREQQLKEVARMQREKKEMEDEKKRIAMEEDLILTQGITYNVFLTVTPLIDDFSEDDRISLPEDALIQLNEQNAFVHGALYFEVTNSSSKKISHCGVREFSAPSGIVKLPPKVLDSLGISTEASTVTVAIRYVRLPPITYMKVRPKASSFFQVGPVKQCLEENLKKHATLTMGDVLTIWYKGIKYVLEVVDMKPERRGTLIDTDVEVDFDVSEESIIRNATQATAAPSDVAVMINSAGTAAASSSISSSSSSSDSSSTYENQYDFNEAEPDITATNVIQIKCKLPNGNVFSRNFSLDTLLSSPFNYVARQMACSINKIKISSRFPPRTFTMATDGRIPISDLAFCNKELLFVSLL